MLKLYNLEQSPKEYWETWEGSSGEHTIHWGALGTRGESKTVKGRLLSPATQIIQKEIEALLAQGFAAVASEDHAILMIEFILGEFGSGDIEKRHRLEDRMNETLGWTGLGACDGGSIGMGTMEVCNFVVDFAIARQVIEEDLAGTEFADYSRIYDERTEFGLLNGTI